MHARPPCERVRRLCAPALPELTAASLPANSASGVDQPIREEEGSMQKLAALHSLHNKRLPQVGRCKPQV